MKSFLVFILTMLIAIYTSANSDYVYPSLNEIDISCELGKDKISELENLYSDAEEPGIAGVAKAVPVDLNGDGVCEIYLDNPPMYEGNGNSFTTILALVNKSYVSIGDIQWDPNAWWYGENENGYPRIFVPTYTGHRTNPIYVTDVYYFNGKSYLKEYDARSSHGYFSDLGLKAYKKEDYISAKKWYLNAYRMRKEKDIADANNLAITYIKLGECEKAIKILSHHLAKPGLNPKQEKSARFNLGLCKKS